jgi:hypothetical protein
MTRAPLWLCALSFQLAACNEHTFAAPYPASEGETDQYVPTSINRKVDVLFMIDNSLSMQQEQDNLARNFPAFISLLRNIEGGLPDLHIGVVTSDLGAGPSAESGCRVGGLAGAFQGWDKSCGLDQGHRFIEASDGERTRNYQGQLEKVFACMAQVGTSGCGYEHQLASTVKALTAPENAGFLRDDAYLQLILITDEDDCSADPSSDLFTMSFPDEEPSYRCARAGHLCQGRPPGDAELNVPLSDCQPSENGALTNVSRFVEQIRALKKDPKKILVSGIFGWPTSGADTYRVGRGEHGHWDYLSACQSENGDATAALRIKQFVDAFGPNHSAIQSICAGDFRPALTGIAGDLIAHIHPLCLAQPPVDTSPDPGVQADCVVSEVVPGAGGDRKTDLPHCQETSPFPCWQLEATDAVNCPASHQQVVIKRNAPPPAESQIAIKCLTCSKPGDPRCALP